MTIDDYEGVVAERETRRKAEAIAAAPARARVNGRQHAGQPKNGARKIAVTVEAQPDPVEAWERLFR